MDRLFNVIKLTQAKDITYSIILIIMGVLISIFASAIISSVAAIVGFIIVIHSAIKIYAIKYVPNSTALPMIFVELAIGITLICHRALLTAIYPVIVALLLIYYFVSKLDSYYKGYEKYSQFDKIFAIVVISISTALLLIPTKWSATIISLLVGITLIAIGVANIARNIINKIRNKPKKNNMNEEIIIEVE